MPPQEQEQERGTRNQTDNAQASPLQALEGPDLALPQPKLDFISFQTKCDTESVSKDVRCKPEIVSKYCENCININAATMLRL